MIGMSLSLRPRKLSLSILNESDGSCALSQGYTCVWGSVMGPGDVRASRQLYDRATLDVFVKLKNGGPEILSKVVGCESVLRDVCKSCILTSLMPRTLIQVTCQEMHDDGSLNAAVINCACMALLDSAIPMRTTFNAVNVAIGKKCDESSCEISLDPDSKRESECRAGLLLVFSPGTDQPELIASSSTGTLTLTDLQASIHIASQAASKNFEMYRNVIKSKFSNDQPFGVVVD